MNATSLATKGMICTGRGGTGTQYWGGVTKIDDELKFNVKVRRVRVKDVSPQELKESLQLAPIISSSSHFDVKILKLD